MVFIRNYHGRSLISIMTDRIFIHRLKNLPLCLPSRRLEVEQARERKTRVSRSRAPVLSCAHYFQAPATQANANLVHRVLSYPSPGNEIASNASVSVA